MTMWKIMIVDDEPKLRRSLRAQVERELPGCAVVAEAEDGERALALLSESEPDIFLVDVRMPFMDGLELADRLSQMPGERSIIMISGHDEFEYAQRALKAKVSDYLLKPVDSALLSAAVEKSKADLSLRRDERGYLSWARAELDRNLPLLRERFFQALLEGDLSRTEADESCAFLGLSLPESGRLIAARLPERFSAFGSENESPRRLLMSALAIIMRRSLEGCDPLFVVQDESEIVIALIPEPKALDGKAIRERIETGCRAAVLAKPVMADRKVTGDLARLAEAWDELRSELAACDNAEAFVEKARELVDGRFSDPNLSLEDVARELQVSPGYLSRLLKRDTGFSFVEYLTRCRITRAVELMTNPALKVFEAAERVGYHSQHYFARAFRKILGVSPSEYRKGKNA
jgi:two-component system, response regulator YesN